MSRIGQVFDRIWPGVVVSLLAALVIGGASGWMDIRERFTRVEVEPDAGLEGVSARLDNVNARLDELVRRVDPARSRAWFEVYGAQAVEPPPGFGQRPFPLRNAICRIETS